MIYSIGLLPLPECQCHAPRESPEHIIMKCFLYNQERLTLMSKVETPQPKFGNFTEKQMLKILLFEIFPDNPDFYWTTKYLQIAVQQFLVTNNNSITSNPPSPHSTTLLPFMADLSKVRWGIHKIFLLTLFPKPWLHAKFLWKRKVSLVIKICVISYCLLS